MDMTRTVGPADAVDRQSGGESQQTTIDLPGWTAHEPSGTTAEVPDGRVTFSG
jgi:hypothetical protein